MTDLAVLPSLVGDSDRANTLAQKLKLTLLTPGTPLRDCEEYAAVLRVEGSSLALQRTGPNAPGPVTVDFGDPAMRYRRRSGANELLGRAVGVGKKPELRILDGTAGLGRDSFVLADLGCIVCLCERHPVIAQLLSAGLEAARESSDEWLHSVASRMHVVSDDVRDYCAGIFTTHAGDQSTNPPPNLSRDVEQEDSHDTSWPDLPPDVIYIDPMFPPRGKSAAVGKEMALLQLLLHQGKSPESEEETDADALLKWALTVDVARVVVKRPLRATSLAQTTPSHCIRGKAVRYDVYVRRSLTRT